jgi:hypothetical protein
MTSAMLSLSSRTSQIRAEGISRYFPPWRGLFVRFDFERFIFELIREMVHSSLLTIANYCTGTTIIFCKIDTQIEF